MCNILGSESYQQNLSPDDKNLIFGPMLSCIANPSTFKFMPGESNSIKGAIEMSKIILIKYAESYDFEKRSHSKKKKKRGISTSLSSEQVSERLPLTDLGNHKNNQSSYSTPQLLSTNPMTVSTAASSLATPVLRKGKTTYLGSWLLYTKSLKMDKRTISYETNDVDCTITCLIPGCEKIKPFNGTVDQHGSWKLSSFVRHLQLVHQPTINHQNSRQLSGSGILILNQ